MRKLAERSSHSAVQIDEVTARLGSRSAEVEMYIQHSLRALEKSHACFEGIAQSVEQIARMAEGNHHAAQQSAEVVRALEQTATDLRSLVRRFRLNG